VSFVGEWMMQTWSVLLQAGPWLVGGFLLAGFIHVLVPVDKVTRHLGKPGLGGVLKAALVGAPLPLCSCSVIPVAAAIRRQGASKGATASFLISTPETGADSFILSYAMLGPFMAIVRPIAALATAIAAGLAIDRLDAEAVDAPHDREEVNATGAGGCCHANTGSGAASSGSPMGPGSQSPGLQNPALISVTSHPGLMTRTVSKAIEAVRYGFGTMFEDLAHWLVLGFVLAGLVSALFPPNLLERYVGSGPWSMLLMLAVGLPMYVCATASTPVAAVLIAKGLSPGAALVFLLAGPATNAATMVVVGRDLGRRSLALYLASIAVVALLFGVLTDLVLVSMPSLATSLHQHVHAAPAGVAWPFAVALAMLILNGLRMRLRTRLDRRPRVEEPRCSPSACCEHE